MFRTGQLRFQPDQLELELQLLTMKRFRILLAMQACLGVQLPGYAAQLHTLVLGADGKPLPNVVVVAIPEDGQLPALKRTVEIVDQIDKEFLPYVKPVRVGSYVK